MHKCGRGSQLEGGDLYPQWTLQISWDIFWLLQLEGYYCYLAGRCQWYWYIHRAEPQQRNVQFKTYAAKNKWKKKKPKYLQQWGGETLTQEHTLSCWYLVSAPVIIKRSQ